MTADAKASRPERDHVHTWFSLSYSNYAVLPRTLLQSMPDEWQARFVKLMDELYDSYRHIEHAEGYDVHAGEWKPIEDCGDEELIAAGVTSAAEDDDQDAEVFYYRGEELRGYASVFVPGRDPVPHYNRGRAFVAPRLQKQEAGR